MTPGTVSSTTIVYNCTIFIYKYVCNDSYPIGSMYAIYGNIYHQYTPNVGIYTIHGSYGYMLTVTGKYWQYVRNHLDLPE